MTKILIISGGVLGLLGGVWLMWEASHDLLWNAVGFVLAFGMIFSALGMWRFKKWALQLSFSVIFFFLFLGCWLEYLVWDMRVLFPDTTLGGVLLELLNPRISMFVIIPIIWFSYFLRPSVRKEFQ